MLEKSKIAKEIVDDHGTVLWCGAWRAWHFCHFGGNATRSDHRNRGGYGRDDGIAELADNGFRHAMTPNSPAEPSVLQGLWGKSFHHLLYWFCWEMFCRESTAKPSWRWEIILFSLFRSSTCSPERSYLGWCLLFLYILWQLTVAAYRPNSSPAYYDSNMDRSHLFQQIVKVLIPPLFLILAVLGSILGGLATTTEAASFGAVGAMLLAATRKMINWKILGEVVRSTTRISCMVFGILIGASIFSLTFRGLGGDEVVEEFLFSLPGGSATALVFVMVLIFPACFHSRVHRDCLHCRTDYCPCTAQSGRQPRMAWHHDRFEPSNKFHDTTVWMGALLPAWSGTLKKSRQAKSIGESFHLLFCNSLHLVLLPISQVLQPGYPKLYSVSCSCHCILTESIAAPITRVIGANSRNSEPLSNSLPLIYSKIICLFVPFVCIYKIWTGMLCIQANNSNCRLPM